METATEIIVVIGACIGVVVLWRVYFRESKYEKVKREIFLFVKSYKRRCTGVNRFVVTVETLQDSFREYDTETINKVWLGLIKERIIEKDPQDGEWCVR